MPDRHDQEPHSDRPPTPEPPTPNRLRQAVGDVLVVVALAAFVVVAGYLGDFVGRVTPLPRLGVLLLTTAPAVAVTARYFRRRVRYWRRAWRLRRRE